MRRPLPSPWFAGWQQSFKMCGHVHFNHPSTIHIMGKFTAYLELKQHIIVHHAHNLLTNFVQYHFIHLKQRRHVIIFCGYTYKNVLGESSTFFESWRNVSCYPSWGESKAPKASCLKNLTFPFKISNKSGDNKCTILNGWILCERDSNFMAQCYTILCNGITYCHFDNECCNAVEWADSL